MNKTRMNIYNNEDSKISVIIPVYNAEEYLKQCLESIINQTFNNLEIICIDDGSTDNSLNILNEYKILDNRIIILTQQNKYAGVARNNGLKNATGKYICFLDGDDFFEQTMLEKLYKKITADDSDVVVCGYYNYDNTDGHIINTHTIKKIFELSSPLIPNDINEYIFNFCRPNPWTKLFKRSLFIKNNLTFDDTICSNDMACIYSALAIANKISILNEPLIYYRSNQVNNLTAKRKDNYTGFISDLKAYESLKQNLKRLNVYTKFKNALLSRGKRNFKSMQTEEYDKIAKTILSDELYQAFYGGE